MVAALQSRLEDMESTKQRDMAKVHAKLAEIGEQLAPLARAAAAGAGVGK